MQSNRGWEEEDSRKPGEDGFATCLSRMPAIENVVTQPRGSEHASG